jgi:phosphonate transport system substrate-binding protein
MRSSKSRFSAPAKGLFRSFLLGAFALTAAPLQAADNPEDWPDTIHFANTELSGLTQLQRKYGPFRDALESALGMEVEFTPVPSRTAAATALQSDAVDVVFTGPAEYVAIRSQTRVRPIIGLTRPGYRSVIAVRNDSGIDSMQDLKGHTLIMEEIGSTSAHLGPTVLLNEAGLEPGKDVEVRMLGDNFIHAFANDRGDALGAGAHDFQYLADEYGNDRYRVIKEGQDLPNDLFLARADMPDDLVAHIREAFEANERQLLDAILSVESNRKYSESGFAPVANNDYDPIREAYRAAGINDFSEAP